MEIEVQTETTDGKLVRVTAERDALARHIEKLSAPITDEEAQTAWAEFESARLTMQEVLTAFVLRRQAAGQFAALP